MRKSAVLMDKIFKKAQLATRGITGRTSGDYTMMISRINQDSDMKLDKMSDYEHSHIAPHNQQSLIVPMPIFPVSRKSANFGDSENRIEEDDLDLLPSARRSGHQSDRLSADMFDAVEDGALQDEKVDGFEKIKGEDRVTEHDGVFFEQDSAI